MRHKFLVAFLAAALLCSSADPRGEPRGQAVTICIPSEGDLDGLPAIMGVLVTSDDVHIRDWELSPGDAVLVHVGAEYKAFLERFGPDDGNPVYVIASEENKGNVIINYQHALDGNVQKVLKPGSLHVVNPVIARRWVFSAKKWE